MRFPPIYCGGLPRRQQPLLLPGREGRPVMLIDRRMPPERMAPIFRMLRWTLARARTILDAIKEEEGQSGITTSLASRRVHIADISSKNAELLLDQMELTDSEIDALEKVVTDVLRLAQDTRQAVDDEHSQKTP